MYTGAQPLSDRIADPTSPQGGVSFLLASPYPLDSDFRRNDVVTHIPLTPLRYAKGGHTLCIQQHLLNPL